MTYGASAHVGGLIGPDFCLTYALATGEITEFIICQNYICTELMCAILARFY